MNYRNCFFISYLYLSELSVFVVNVLSVIGLRQMKRSLMQFKCLFCVLYAEFCPWWTPGVWVSETCFFKQKYTCEIIIPC